VPQEWSRPFGATICPLPSSRSRSDIPEVANTKSTEWPADATAASRCARPKTASSNVSRCKPAPGLKPKR